MRFRSGTGNQPGCGAGIHQHCEQRGYGRRGREAELESEMPRFPSGGENRRSPRVASFHRVRFGATSPVEPGETGDMSESGLYVISEHPLEVGSSVTVMIELADRDLHMTGVVRWVRNQHDRGRAPGMGIQLDAAPPGYLQHLRSLR